MSFLDKVIGSGIKDVVTSIGDTAKKFIHTKDDEEAFTLEITKLAQEKELKLVEAAQSEIDSYLKDTQSARDTNVSIQESDKASWMSKNIAYIIDSAITLVWCTFTIYLGLRAINLIASGSVDLTAVLSLYATVTAVFMTVLNFHRGTSKGSEKSGDAIRRIAEK